jgi:tetratricopeptide (TPR) repeat protein
MDTSFTLDKGVPDDITDATERRLLELASDGLSLAAMALELRRSEFETADLAMALHGRGLLKVADAPAAAGADHDPIGTIRALLAEGYKRLTEKRYELALEAYERVLTLDRLNQNAKKGLVAAIEARDRERSLKKVPLDKVPRLTMDMASLTRQNFDPQEGFVLSRVNGMWDVGSILKLCPMNESDVLLIFARLLERKVIELN